MNVYLLVIILYILIILLIGISLRKYVKSSSDFFVGGRKFNTAFLFTTLITANIGAGSTVGVAGLGYRYGISAWWWIGASAIGSLLLAFTVGPKIWRIASQYNMYTLGDYLDHRYHAVFRLVMALMMAVGTMALFAGQLLGIAWILTVVAGTSKTVGVLIGALVVSLYFIVGGILSSTVVNIFQLVMILSGFLIALPYSLQHIGGWEQLTLLIEQGAPEKAEGYFSFTGIGLKQIIGYIFLLTPSFIISPGLIQKIFSAKNEQVVKTGTLLNAIVQLGFAFIPVVIGMVAFAAFPTLENQDLALPMVMKEMLPIWIGAIALAAIFAAEVSTADSVLFMITSSLTKDIYGTFIRKEMNDQELLKVSRVITVLSGIASVILALFLQNIISSLSIFYTLMSVALTAPLIFGLYSKGASTTAAVLSSGLGIVVTLWVRVVTDNQGYFLFTPQAIGMLISIGLMLTAVLIYPKK